MSANITSWMKKHPVPAFYILAFSITWLGWIPQAAYSRGLFPFDSVIFYILGGIGPLLAVFIMLKILHGRIEYGEVFRPLWQWRSGAVWYFVALFGYPLMWIAALALSGELSSGFAKLGPPLAILSSFLIAFVAAIPEQVAWRGFALSRLQVRYSALNSSLIVGVLWALWHLPLLLNTDSVMSTYPAIIFTLEVIARSVIHTWIFNSTRGSLLFVTLFHAASNIVSSTPGIESLVVTYVVVVVLLIVFGSKHLSSHGERSSPEEVTQVAPQTG